jgi:hypothetical protein
VGYRIEHADLTSLIGYSNRQGRVNRATLAPLLSVNSLGQERNVQVDT